MKNSAIEWTESTWNPVRGCSVTSPGCNNCYAMRQANRFSGSGKPYEGLTKLTSAGPQWTGSVRMAPRHILDAPIRWRRPRLVFVNSMSDLFHEALSDDDIDRVFGVMWACQHLGKHAYPGHTFQVLTKRAERMRDYMAQDRRRRWAESAVEHGGGVDPDALFDSVAGADGPHPRIWLGVSVEDQRRADERIPLLLQVPAAVHFVSCEPLLGPVDLSRYLAMGSVCECDTSRTPEVYPPEDRCTKEMIRCNAGTRRVDWTISGGESGPGARPSHPDWFRALRDQCAGAKQMGEITPVPFLMKQWGAWAPRSHHKGVVVRSMRWGTVGQEGEWWAETTPFNGHDDDGVGLAEAVMLRLGKKHSGRELDGRTWNEFPVIEQQPV